MTPWPWLVLACSFQLAHRFLANADPRLEYTGAGHDPRRLPAAWLGAGQCPFSWELAIGRPANATPQNAVVLGNTTFSCRLLEGPLSNEPASLFETLQHPAHSLVAIEEPSSFSSSKYFHEAPQDHHFDERFFQSTFSSKYERVATLGRLARAYLRFCTHANVTTWLAHGTLLGWHWNQRSLPWDNDVDAQVAETDLKTLAKYNQTVVYDLHGFGRASSAHIYLLDVSSAIHDRGADAANTIDARFIDAHTGMFVDITAVSPATDYEESLFEIIDPTYREVLQSAAVEPLLKSNRTVQLAMQAAALVQQKQVLCCKNRHCYLASELHLKDTTFEGVPAKVPVAHKSILSREYPKGRWLRHYNEWVFRSHLGVWIHQSVCKGDRTGKTCKDPEALLESTMTELPDPWIMRLKSQSPLL